MGEVRSYPEGAITAMVSSWRGGSRFDERLAETLDKFGWRGTFFIDPDRAGEDGYLDEVGIRGLADSGHQIGLFVQDPIMGQPEIVAARERLTQMAGGPVISCAWSIEGQVPDEAAAAAARAGFRVGQVCVEDVIRASEVADWLRVPVSASATLAFDQINERWAEIESAKDGIFHLWGSSAAYGEDDDNWAQIECNLAWFCGHAHAWYCTLADVEALRD